MAADKVDLRALRLKLKRAGLTEPELALVLERLPGSPGRPKDAACPHVHQLIAMLIELYEAASGKPLPKLRGLGRSTIYNKVKSTIRQPTGLSTELAPAFTRILCRAVELDPLIAKSGDASMLITLIKAALEESKRKPNTESK
jgi:hypothetical protein